MIKKTSDTSLSYEQLGAVIKKLRKKRGLSQRALADKVGVSAPLICEIEKGYYSGSKNLFPIAQCLGVTVEQLVTGDIPDVLPAVIEEKLSVLERAEQSFEQIRGLIAELTPTADEAELLRKYRALSDEKKAEVRDYLQFVARKAK